MIKPIQAIVLKKIQQLLERGSCLGISQNGYKGILVADFEILENPRRIFWVPMFGFEPQQAHHLTFETATIESLGVTFRDSKGDFVGHLAPYSEWPEISTDNAMITKAQWVEYLKDRTNREAWNRGVDVSRKAY